MRLVVTLGTVRSTSAQRIVWHAHEGYELLFLLEGATAYEVRGSGCVELTGGHFLLIPPRTVHRGAHDLRMPSVLCGVLFEPASGNAWRHTVFTRAELRAIGLQLKAVSLTVRPLSGELRRLVVRIMEEAEAVNSGQADAATKASLRALACLAILEATRQLASPGKAGPTELVAAAMAYLRHRFAEPVRMPELARYLGLGRARMFELFKKTSGVTPNNYLLRYRIEQACTLLATTGRSITDVAMATGFSSSQYFSNVFRKYASASPSEYRFKHLSARRQSER
jgi:AraC-like DNA-binding protein